MRLLHDAEMAENFSVLEAERNYRQLHAMAADISRLKQVELSRQVRQQTDCVFTQSRFQGSWNGVLNLRIQFVHLLVFLGDGAWSRLATG